ncbi:MAG: hypothetical protein KDK25_04410 [Leptospiraceae bacterium]|nr:hypothetical protein [Leptospiraceae bacterium]
MRKAVHPVYGKSGRPGRKQKAIRACSIPMLFLPVLAVALATYILPGAASAPLQAEPMSELVPMPGTPSLDFQSLEAEAETPRARTPVIQAYEIWDARYCELTPRPFLCRKCILSDRQFVRILTFEKDGRPVRNYACRSFEEPYLY